MNIQYFKPTGILSNFIKYYWLLETDNLDGIISERVIPTGNIELMFHYKKSFLVKHNNSSLTIPQPQSFISGIDSSYADVFTRGESGMIAVTFYPLGACNFFAFPLHEIENRNVDLGCICKSEIKSMEERLGENYQTQERIRIVEEFLYNRLSLIENQDIAILKEALHFINQSRGQINASNLSGRLSVTTKSLERKFGAYMGKSPKQFIKIVRFQHIINNFSKEEKSQLTRVAYDSGYFDQAHFIKDFKSFTGYAPKEFFTNHQCVSDYFN